MSKFVDLEMDIIAPGPLLAFADDNPIVAPAPFEDAVDHWRFGGSSGSRTGLVAGRRLRRGLAQSSVTLGTGYTSAPPVALAGAGAAGLSATSFLNGSGGVASTVITGQPSDDTSPVTATFSGGGGSGAAVTLSRGVEPSYTEHSAIIAAGRQNGLISDIDDALVYSELYLIKRPALATQQWIGGSAIYPGWSGTGAAVGGDGFFWTTANTIQWQNASGNVTFAPPASWVPGTWGVLVITYNGANGGVAYAVGPSRDSTSVAQPNAKTLAAPMRKRALGGLNYDFGSGYIALEISEYVYFASSLVPGKAMSRAYDVLDNYRINALT